MSWRAPSNGEHVRDKVGRPMMLVPDGVTFLAPMPPSSLPSPRITSTHVDHVDSRNCTWRIETRLPSYHFPEWGKLVGPCGGGWGESGERRSSQLGMAAASLSSQPGQSSLSKSFLLESHSGCDIRVPPPLSSLAHARPSTLCARPARSSRRVPLAGSPMHACSRSSAEGLPRALHCRFGQRNRT